MAQAEVGALRVTIGMNVGEFEDGAKKAAGILGKLQTSFDSAASAIKANAAIIAGAAVGAFSSLAAGIQLAINRADELGKLSQKIGIPVEQLSALKHAAELSDVSLEGLGTGVKKLSVNLQEIAGGNTSSAAARSLQALGISATDASGHLRSSGDVINDVADRFANMEDGAGKTALAVNLFGRSGSDLIPLLNGGSAGLQEMADEAAKLGLIISTRTAKDAEVFNDNLTKLGATFGGVFNRLAADFVPILATLSTKLVNLVKDFDLVKTAASILSSIFAALLTPITAITGALIAAGQGALALFNIVKRIVTLDFSGANQAFFEGFENIKNTAAGTVSTIGQLWGALGPEAEQAATNFEEKAAAPIVASQERIAAATRSARDAERERQQLLKEGERLQKSVATEWERANMQIERASFLLRQGAIDHETYGRVAQKASQVTTNAYASAAGAIIGNLGTIFNDAKGFAVAQALINSFEAATKALSAYPPPFNAVAAATTLAAGLAQVANIRKTNRNSSGGGGEARGSLQQAANVNTQAAAPAQQQSLFVQGLGSDQLFTGSMVRDLAEKLIDFQRDGGKVVFA